MQKHTRRSAPKHVEQKRPGHSKINSRRTQRKQGKFLVHQLGKQMKKLVRALKKLRKTLTTHLEN